MISRSPKRGLTLVELLVLIAIAALLLSFLAPALAQSKEADHRNECEVADQPVNAETRVLGLWTASTNPANVGKTALNFGSLASDPSPKNISFAIAGTGTNTVATAAGVSASEPWGFGPSSEHPGIVQHLTADGAVKAINENIDPTVYMHLITRAGKEPDAIPQ